MKCIKPTFLQNKIPEKNQFNKHDCNDERNANKSGLTHQNITETPPLNFQSKSKQTFFSNIVDNTFNNNKRPEIDSKLSLNFLRGFRRENSDFFPLSKRHSAILGERQSVMKHIVPHRTSAIYTKHDAINNDEPILMDFVSRSYLDSPPNTNKTSATPTTTKTATTASLKNNAANEQPTTNQLRASNANNVDQNQCNNQNNNFFIGPRREKTESVILLRNSSNYNLLFNKQQQVKLFTHKQTQKHSK